MVQIDKKSRKSTWFFCFDLDNFETTQNTIYKSLLVGKNRYLTKVLKRKRYAKVDETLKISKQKKKDYLR